MNKLALALLALLAVSQAQISQEVAAGESFDLPINVLFSGSASAGNLISKATFQNGNADALITFTPFATLSSALDAAVSDSINFITTVKFGVGFSLTANVTGSGTFSVTYSAAATSFPGFSANGSVAVATPFASGSQSTNSIFYIPSVSLVGSATANFSLSFEKNYTFGILAPNTQVGFSASKPFQAAYNTSTVVAARAYVVFSSNADQAVVASATTSNSFVQLLNSFGTAVGVTITQNFIGRAASSGSIYAAPANTNNSIGIQYSIEVDSNNFNGNLTYNSNSNGVTYTTAQASTFSWYKSATGNIGATGWTKVPSTATVDANGNLQVVTGVTGTFSEWTVASDSSTPTSTSTSSVSSNPTNGGTPTSARSSASSIVIGSLAVVSAAVLLF